MVMGHPPAEVTVDAVLARALLEAQHPAFADHAPTLADEGWDNFTFRLGARHALRVPRREVAVELILKEQRWLFEVASRLELGFPRIVGVGAPSELFAWPWSVVEWVEGPTADVVLLGPGEARVLADALRRLHAPAPPEAPINPFRGVPLERRRDVLEERIERLGMRELDARWRGALEAPPAEEAVWIHGDLHPRNVVVTERGALAGLIDWGDMAAGDRATDLACAWTLFDSASARAAFLDAYGATGEEQRRAAGWAVVFATMLVGSGDRRHEELGRVMVARLTGAR